MSQEFVAGAFDPFVAMNAIGLVAFALVGSTKAIREEFDLFGVVLAIGLHLVLEAPDDHPITLFADGVGLAAFTTAGAIVAVDVGVSGFGVVAIATINAVGGGAIADVLLDRSPFILFEDFYASCAVLGGTVYLGATLGGAAGSTAAIACAAVTVLTRMAAITYGWTVPTAQTLRRREGVGKE